MLPVLTDEEDIFNFLVFWYLGFLSLALLMLIQNLCEVKTEELPFYLCRSRRFQAVDDIIDSDFFKSRGWHGSPPCRDIRFSLITLQVIHKVSICGRSRLCY
jgi:hypothetical protein